MEECVIVLCLIKTLSNFATHLGAFGHIFVMWPKVSKDYNVVCPGACMVPTLLLQEHIFRYDL